MKQFSLKEYLENPNKRIITRDGKSVKILCTDKRDENDYNIVALIHEKDEDVCDTFTIDGKYSSSTKDHYNDLFFATEKKEGWIHLCKNSTNYPYVRSSVFETKEEAEKYRRANDDTIATIKIEWEE